MTEKQLNELLSKLAVEHPMAQVIRTILSQYVSIKQVKLTIKSMCTQYKLEELYKEVVEKDK